MLRILKSFSLKKKYKMTIGVDFHRDTIKSIEKVLQKTK
ncbi:MAG: hypothetical protein BAJALOKI1v1_260018 [Promethearchaeota archaeon]|nr:MAG: hypothetical protein BAJALOKI1v1_260018 [Candidatus Lokiarchaeota archaeon]